MRLVNITCIQLIKCCSSQGPAVSQHDGLAGLIKLYRYDEIRRIITHGNIERTVFAILASLGRWEMLTCRKWVGGCGVCGRRPQQVNVNVTPLILLQGILRARNETIMESISRISFMLETGRVMHKYLREPQLIWCTARELTLEAAQSAGSSRSFSSRSSTRDLPFTQIKKLLDSRNDREILEGLRKVISVRSWFAGPPSWTSV